MSALDGFYTTWDNARQTFGQGTPQSGTDFDKSPQLTNLGSGLDAAAPGSKWSGAAATNYDKANADHQKVFTQLAELDRKIAQQVDQSAQVVATGRQNLDQVRQWVTDAANSVPPGKQRDMFLMQIANKGLGQLTEVVNQTNAQSNTVAQNIAKLGPEFDALTRDQKFGNGEKDEKKDDVDALGDEEMRVPPDYREDSPGELTPEEGRADGESLGDGMLSPQQRERLLEAGTLPQEQLDALARGEEAVVGEERMAYLYQLSQSMNGMTPEQIKGISESLPPDERAALAQSLAIVSNPNALSGNNNTEGVTDETRDNFVPAAGSLANLPDGMHEELSRGDRVVVNPAHTVPTGSMFPAHIPESVDLNGVGAMQDISDIMKPAAGEYLNGSETTRAMLDASSQYAAADAKYPDDRVQADHHGNTLPGSLADVIQVAGNDHVSVHDLSTNPSTRDNFLHGMTAENWGEHSSKVGDAFRWTGGDPHNPIASETANSVAHYLSEHKVDLQHMPDGGTFGSVNGGLLQAMADGTAPYLAQLAGADAATGFTAPGIEHFKSEEAMRDMFSVFDQDHEAGTTANNAALQHQQYLELSAAEHGVQGNQVEVAARLGEAMSTGAEDAKAFGQAAHQWQITQDNQRAGTMFDTGYGALTALAEMVPGGQIPAAALTVLGPEFKSELLPDVDPTTIQGDSFFTDQLSQNRFNNTTDNYATALQGLINAHPEIANDPVLESLITNGAVDTAAVADGTNNADDVLNDWFEDHGEQYGYDEETWATQRQNGRDNNNWSH
ncbi:EspA/EspE family type VII secretion system effector [Mycolicibacterium litorale]|uniref:TPR repeat region-containing protein n=1 Tax=Mycolicibacterium litorale TaxID=758802 RepID=UPI003CE9BD8E